MLQNHQYLTHKQTSNGLCFSLLILTFLLSLSTTSFAQVCLSGDCQNGVGRWKSKTGDTYEGNFRSGKFRGEGTMKYANGDKYEGTWLNGAKNGSGTYTWKNGDVYTGEWYSDKRYGRGKIVFKDGRQYQGSWIDDMYEGAGKFIWEDGTYFRGRFKKDIPVSGILRFDRHSYQGKWEQKRTSATDYYYKFVSGIYTIATWKDGNLTDKRNSDSEEENSSSTASNSSTSSNSSRDTQEQGPSFDGNNNLPSDRKSISNTKSNTNSNSNNTANNSSATANSDSNASQTNGEATNGESTTEGDSTGIIASDSVSQEGQLTAAQATAQDTPPPLPKPQDKNNKKSLTERYGKNFNYLVDQLESDKKTLLKKQERVQEEIESITAALENEDLSPEDKKELEGFLHRLEATLLNTASELQQVTIRSAEIIQDMRNTILEQKSTIKLIKEDQERKRNQLILTVSLLFIAFISLAVMFGLYRNLRKKNNRIAQQNREIAEQKEVIELSRNELERQNKNVISSINYASRMQTAMLPSHDIINQAFPDGFVLLMPCKIVSGDFYWIAQRDRYTYVAAIDCTGHGVPGAFMSLIGNDILNDLVHRKELVSPREILHHLHTEVVLHMTRGNSEARDGMDMGLCVIDHESKELHFSGAMNPLLIVKDGEVMEIKGTRKPIGGQELERRSDKPFEEHTLQLEGDESCYLFSDGYRDQFGGPNNKKLMKKGFIKMLGKCHHLSMDKQRDYMRNFFNEWKGDGEQLDDVLVIGFRPLDKKAVKAPQKEPKAV